MNNTYKVRENLIEQERSQRWLARRTGISPTTINALCSDNPPDIRVSTLYKIGKALGLHPCDLVVFTSDE